MLAVALGAALAGCAGVPSRPEPGDRLDQFRGTNRIGWGATGAQLDQIALFGWRNYAEKQLQASATAKLFAAAQVQIDELSNIRRSALDLATELDELRRNQDSSNIEAERIVARRAYQARMNAVATGAAQRRLLRALYSESQLFEHINTFWFNHFNVHQGKRDIRLLIADYEESALRPHALGSFRSMLGAVARHPAMLRYLDNDQNGSKKINENYARELLELHTLGVGGGYAQSDVQELARVLTGFGMRIQQEPPKLPARLEKQYLRDGLFEFNPARHDYGDKQLLGRTIRGSGSGELDEVLDLLVAHPSTARFISRKLAVYFLSDDPPQAVVDRMSQAFHATGGDIKATLRPLLLSSEFVSSAPSKFKDPQHYLISAIRVAFEGQVLQNTQPLIGWLRRMGQGPYDRQSPDGYPSTAAAWNSAGQMAVRFEIARQIGYGAPALFRSAALSAPISSPVPPNVAQIRQRFDPFLSAQTKAALAQATTPQLWLTLLLSSPEFMVR
jgi:uncharacterized protein (DUF1800 family)